MASGSPPLDTVALSALVEECGRKMLFFEEHRNSWDDAEWERRLTHLSERISVMSAALQGQPMADYGWDVSGRGVWHRVGEEPLALFANEEEARSVTKLRAALTTGDPWAFDMAWAEIEAVAA